MSNYTTNEIIEKLEKFSDKDFLIKRKENLLNTINLLNNLKYKVEQGLFKKSRVIGNLKIVTKENTYTDAKGDKKEFYTYIQFPLLVSKKEFCKNFLQNINSNSLSNIDEIKNGIIIQVYNTIYTEKVNSIEEYNANKDKYFSQYNGLEILKNTITMGSLVDIVLNCRVNHKIIPHQEIEFYKKLDVKSESKHPALLYSLEDYLNEDKIVNRYKNFRGGYEEIQKKLENDKYKNFVKLENYFDGKINLIFGANIDETKYPIILLPYVKKIEAKTIEGVIKESKLNQILKIDNINIHKFVLKEDSSEKEYICSNYIDKGESVLLPGDKIKISGYENIVNKNGKIYNNFNINKIIEHIQKKELEKINYIRNDIEI